MQTEIRDFLRTTAVFRDVPLDQLGDIATLFHVERHPAGAVVLKQDATSPAVYFIRSGRMAVRINRGEVRETVAHLQPPEIFGELSLITGRAAIADVEVELDAELLVLPRDSVNLLPERRDAILRGLLQVTAERLQRTVIGKAKAADLPVVLLHNGPHFEAPRAFARCLAASLGGETGRQTLLVELGAEGGEAVQRTDGYTSQCCWPVRTPDADMRARLAAQLTEWRRAHDIIVLNPCGQHAAAIGPAIAGLTNFQGYLLGPGDPVPLTPATGSAAAPSYFVVQSAARPSLPELDGHNQLLQDAAGAEERGVSPRFKRTVDSIARHIGRIQVGVALGGGAAWGWAHIGVLSVIEKAGLPVDLLSGCSMGSVIGALRSTGMSIDEMTSIADYWRTRTRRFIEWRLWKMCLVNEKVALKVFESYFGGRAVNEADTPYWANAVDITKGKEYAIKDGTLVQCIRASIALPGLLPPLGRDKATLVDAGIMDPVPVKLIRAMGADFAVAVNAMSPIDEAPVRRRYPFNAFDVMMRCMFVMGHEIGQARAESAADIVMAPLMSGITMLEFDQAPEIIARGKRTAEAQIDTIVARYNRLKNELHGGGKQAGTI
ncbi:MAG: cyclic nucleotide-binding domain-containing protein [Acidobacteria bacterium]|nr:cyclic nucleotide-binding domain-containing protein [Acidobacteriota bacterium]